MTKKANLYKEQQKKKNKSKKIVPVNRYEKPPSTRKGNRSVKPSKQTKAVNVDKGKRSAKPSKQTKEVDVEKGKRFVKPSKQTKEVDVEKGKRFVKPFEQTKEVDVEKEKSFTESSEQTNSMDLDKEKSFTKSSKQTKEVDVDEVMSEVEGSSQPPAVAPQPPVRNKIAVTFDMFGSPVGPESAKFTSFVGRYVRAHICITYMTWKLVPKGLKDQLWKAVTDAYEVPNYWREKIVTRASIPWREYKANLRETKIYKQTRPLEDIKKDNPLNIRVEDWALFVDQSFTSRALKMRAWAQKARAKNFTLHRTGRLGAARTKYKMEQENPGKMIGRAELFVKIHTGKDGTCLNEALGSKLGQIREIIEANPSSVNLDIDHDPVANVYGKDTRGQVRGYGIAVSRTVLKGALPMIDQLQNESHCFDEQRIREIVRDIIREEFGHRPDLRPPVFATSRMPSESEQNHTYGNVTVDVDLLDLTATVVAVGRTTLLADGGGPHMCDVFVSSVLVPTAPVALDPAKRIMSQVKLGSIVQWPTVLLKKRCV